MTRNTLSTRLSVTAAFWTRALSSALRASGSIGVILIGRAGTVATYAADNLRSTCRGRQRDDVQFCAGQGDTRAVGQLVAVTLAASRHGGAARRGGVIVVQVAVQLADFGEGRPFTDRVVEIRAAAAEGARSIWVNHGQHVDALTLLAIAGQDPVVRGCRLGTAVLPVYGRDPVLLARQIASVQAALDGPLSVGLGASHPTSPTASLGSGSASPLRDVRAFVEETRKRLAVVVPVIGGPAPAIYLSTGGPRMLEMAVSISADGVLSTLTTPRTYHDVFLPAVAAHVATYGRPAPEVVASEHVCLTDDPDECLARLSPYVSLIDSLARYQAVMARQGLRSASETFVIGGEAAITRRVREYRDAGVDEFVGVVVGNPEERARTRAFLASLTSSL
jgi:5,10-methylenetetrahydromethanopterin reductase